MGPRGPKQAKYVILLVGPTWAQLGPKGPRHHGQTTQSDWLEPWAQALIIFEVGFRRPNTLGGPGTLDY